MRIIHLIEFLLYIIGLIGMVQMHMDFAMYMMFAGMILGCVSHLLWPAKK
ncbi:hypothetical protein [Paucilactobacillus wasatchensis]|uniref:Uncharacterized protein n=1 Tax=Paucilactobacillus wasatchensis TaxID=1335616 RepID=A0A0D1A4K1_9LACO|nr:hypothetical protein [Paucilactobacillus wasatchensis]KIS02602.1 hypothetical protein WDC_1828 [Paucilactobacillus wasatchensis]